MSELYDRLKQGLNEADAYLSGEETGAKVHIPAEWDVKRIRTKLGMTQAAFAESFRFSVDAVRHWEAGRRVPEAAARAYLRVIDVNARAVTAALSLDEEELRAMWKKASENTQPGLPLDAVVDRLERKYQAQVDQAGAKASS